MRSRVFLSLAFLCLGSFQAAAEELDLAAATALAEDPAQLQRTWEQGFVMVPGAALGADAESFFGVFENPTIQGLLSQVPADARLPAVVYLHGCAGFGLTGARFQAIADESGYAVFMPNSFAREPRPRNCNVYDYSSGMFPAAWLYRRAELIHAVERARALPWVDPQRILVAGFSEGGVAVTLWGGEVEAKGHIVLGWTCTAPEGWDWLTGLRTPPERPALAIISRDDPWFGWPGWQGDCGSAAPGHEALESLVLDHGGHYVLAYPEAERAVRDFLGRLADAPAE